MTHWNNLNFIKHKKFSDILKYQEFERIKSMFELLVTRPLGFIINIIYNLVDNYGLAIIFFTIIVKLILMPLAVKSQKAMRKQQKIQPYLLEIQKKYENDKEKLQMETMKLYRENNISMTGGCLPLLIQMPILFGLYSVIQKPLTYLAGVDFSLSQSIEKVTEIVARMSAEYPDIIGKVASQSVEQIVKHSQIQLSTWCNILFGSGDSWVIDFDFFGLDLSVVPSVSANYILSGNFQYLDRVLLILIPVFAIFTTWLSMRQSQKMSGSPENANVNETAQSMTKSMNLTMPIITGIFSFTLPAGLGIYWIISNVMQMLQQYLLNLYFKKKGDDFDVKIPERNRKNSKKHR